VMVLGKPAQAGLGNGDGARLSARGNR
jgi:hypothetical protein